MVLSGYSDYDLSLSVCGPYPPSVVVRSLPVVLAGCEWHTLAPPLCPLLSSPESSVGSRCDSLQKPCSPCNTETVTQCQLQAQSWMELHKKSPEKLPVKKQILCKLTMTQFVKFGNNLKGIPRLPCKQTYLLLWSLTLPPVATCDTAVTNSCKRQK